MQKKKVFIKVVAAVFGLATAGCTGVPEVFQTATADEKADSSAGYCLQPGDEIDVQVYREPQLSGVFQVDTGGAIRYPLTGAVRVAGLTVEQAEQELTDRLGENYLVNPRVMMSVASARDSHVVVLGEVKNPGVQPFPFGGSMTLLQAVAEAGGFTDLARVDRVTVTRVVDGKEQSIRVRVSKMISGQEPDLDLEPNDVIMIPEIIF